MEYSSKIKKKQNSNRTIGTLLFILTTVIFVAILLVCIIALTNSDFLESFGKELFAKAGHHFDETNNELGFADKQWKLIYCEYRVIFLSLISVVPMILPITSCFIFDYKHKSPNWALTMFGICLSIVVAVVCGIVGFKQCPDASLKFLLIVLPLLMILPTTISTFIVFKKLKHNTAGHMLFYLFYYLLLLGLLLLAARTPWLFVIIGILAVASPFLEPAIPVYVVD